MTQATTRKAENVKVAARDFNMVQGNENVTVSFPLQVSFDIMDGDKKDKTVRFGFSRNGGRQTYRIIGTENIVRLSKEEFKKQLVAAKLVNAKELFSMIDTLSVEVKVGKVTHRLFSKGFHVGQCSSCQGKVFACEMDYIQKHAHEFQAGSEFRLICMKCQPKFKVSGETAAPKENKLTCAQEGCDAVINQNHVNYCKTQFKLDTGYCMTHQKQFKKAEGKPAEQPIKPVGVITSDTEVKEYIENLKKKIEVAPQQTMKKLNESSAIKVARDLIKAVYEQYSDPSVIKKHTKDQLAGWISDAMVKMMGSLEEAGLAAKADSEGMEYRCSKCRNKQSQCTCKSKKESASEASASVPALSNATEVETPTQESSASTTQELLNEIPDHMKTDRERDREIREIGEGECEICDGTGVVYSNAVLNGCACGECMAKFLISYGLYTADEITYISASEASADHSSPIQEAQDMDIPASGEADRGHSAAAEHDSTLEQASHSLVSGSAVRTIIGNCKVCGCTGVEINTESTLCDKCE